MVTAQAPPAAAVGAVRPWRDHVRGTLTLGLPLVFTLLLQMAIGVVDTVMVGRLGVQELAGGVLAFQAFFVVSIVALGLAQAMAPVVSGALSADDPVTARRTARMLVWSVVALGFGFTLVMGDLSGLFLLLGQEETTSRRAADYLAIVRFAMVANFVLYALRALLAAVEDTPPIVAMMVFLTLANAFLNWVFIFGNLGAPALGLEGAALASAIALWATALLSFLHARFARSMAPLALTRRVWRPDTQALAKVWRLGLPVVVTILAEAGLFAAASLLVGTMGEVALAAHGIALQLASIAFMVPLGLSQAASVRVGTAWGRASAGDVRRAGRAATALGLALACLFAVLFLVMPVTLVDAFLAADDPDRAGVIAVAVPMLAMAAAFQLFDTLQVTASGNLRGLQDTRVPMVIATIAYWLVGVPVAAWFGLRSGYGAPGVWAGLVVGLAVAALLLGLRFERLSAPGALTGSSGPRGAS